jgi:cytochrome c553
MGSERRRRWGRSLLCGLGLALAAPLHAADEDPVPDTLAQRLLACTACHGRDGRSTLQGYVPRIAGKPAGYLFNQLRHFRDGRRPHPGMAKLLQFMTDGYLREIAGHFAALEVPYAVPPPSAQPVAVLQRGQQLAQQGDAALKLPACGQCHGTALMGVAPQVPGLLGLPRDYLVAQVGAWQTGQRRAQVPDCMAQVARRLSAADLAAVTAWLAAQPVPAATRPADAAPPQPMGLQALGLDCGAAP